MKLKQTKFYPLAFDCQRCVPTAPSDLCKTCARWADHPEQTWGARTAVGKAEPESSTCYFVDGYTQ